MQPPLKKLLDQVRDAIRLKFHKKHHPKEQPLSALLFLYHEMFNLDITGIDALRAKRLQYVLTVLAKEAIAVI